ncbi:MAG TPA: exo-alpha-sialidase, partial [Pseudolabrys sp.]|nr:exo-alpha-sialidase [Pseudolabrys sp.]
KDEMRVPRDGALAVSRTNDGGKTWQSFRKGLPQRDAFDLIYRHGFDVDAAGKRLAMGSTTGNLWASDDAGESWALVNAHLPPIYAVRFY